MTAFTCLPLRIWEDVLHDEYLLVNRQMRAPFFWKPTMFL